MLPRTEANVRRMADRIADLEAEVRRLTTRAEEAEAQLDRLNRAAITAVDYYLDNFGTIDLGHPIMQLRAALTVQIPVEQAGDDHP